MNIARFMLPKISTVFLHENDTVRQGLERFTRHGFTAVPVLNEKDQYIGSVTEGDFLRHLLYIRTTDAKALEHTCIGEIVRRDFCPALTIDADYAEVMTAISGQNFVPIVDGRKTLCGILTRQKFIAYLDSLIRSEEISKEEAGGLYGIHETESGAAAPGYSD